MPRKRTTSQNTATLVQDKVCSDASPQELEHDARTQKRKRSTTPPLIVQGSRTRKPSRRYLESNIASVVPGPARAHVIKRVVSSDESDAVDDDSLPTFSVAEEHPKSVDSARSDTERNSDGIPVELVRQREGKKIESETPRNDIVRLTNETVFLEDLTTPNYVPPAEDETKIPNRDRIFGNTYKGLVNLPATSLVSPRHGRTAQTASLDKWYEAGGIINTTFLRYLYMFDQEDSFVNLSRANPGFLSTRRISSMTNNVGLIISNRGRNDFQYAMCISIIYVSDCSIYTPRRPFTLDGPGLRVIEGDFLVQEFERLLGCLGAVFKTATFGFDLFMLHFQFRTFVERQTGSNGDKVSRTPEKPGSSFAVSVASPRSISTSSSVRLALPATEHIPIYDFTKRVRPFDPSIDLYPAKTNAPLYEEDIPKDALALVAYTVNTYERKTEPGVPYLGFNLHWAALIGTPAP